MILLICFKVRIFWEHQMWSEHFFFVRVCIDYSLKMNCKYKFLLLHIRLQPFTPSTLSSYIIWGVAICHGAVYFLIVYCVGMLAVMSYPLLCVFCDHIQEGSFLLFSFWRRYTSASIAFPASAAKESHFKI